MVGIPGRVSAGAAVPGCGRGGSAVAGRAAADRLSALPPVRETGDAGDGIADGGLGGGEPGGIACGPVRLTLPIRWRMRPVRIGEWSTRRQVKDRNDRGGT